MGGRSKVLVLMTSPLDKIVHALRVVDCLTCKVPELEVTWVVRRVYEPLVSAFPFVRRTIVFRRSGALARSASLVRQIRRERYDYVLDFEGLARTGAMSLLSNANRKIGLRSAREGATICYREVIGKPASQMGHLIEAMTDFGSVFGVNLEVTDWLSAPYVGPVPDRWLDAGREGKRRVCLFPGRFKSERAWPGMMGLATRLANDREDVSVFLLGVVPWHGQALSDERVCDLQLSLSWPQILTLLGEADLVVANDNGPAQLAGALGRKNLTLYTYVSPERRGSYPVSLESNGYLQAPGGKAERFDEGAVFREATRLLEL